MDVPPFGISATTPLAHSLCFESLPHPLWCFVAALSVSQIIFEGMLEDVNNVLNSGDVPNLYGPEEMETIMTTCRRDCLAKRITPTKINIFAQVRRAAGHGARSLPHCELAALLPTPLRACPVVASRGLETMEAAVCPLDVAVDCSIPYTVAPSCPCTHSTFPRPSLYPPPATPPHPTQYLIRVRQNIHVVVTMSPMGEQFRSRLRMFPGLVNCCTIDWFGAWPGTVTAALVFPPAWLDGRCVGGCEAFHIQ